MNTDAKLDEAQKQVAEFVARVNDVAVKAPSELARESHLRRNYKFNMFQIVKEKYPVSIRLCRIAKSLRCFLPIG